MSVKLFLKIFGIFRSCIFWSCIFSAPYGVRLGNGLWVGVWVQTFYFAMVGLGQSCGRLGWRNSTHGQQLWYVNISPVFLDKAQYGIYIVADRKIRRVKVKVDKMSLVCHINMSYINEKLRRLVYMKQVCRCVCRSIQVNVVQYRAWSESAGILWKFRQLQQH